MLLSNVLSDPTCYLAKAKPVFPHINQIESNKEPLFKGTPDDYINVHGQQFDIQLKNKVLHCKYCGKSNGFTLSKCNQCHKSLEGVPVSKTPNVFTSFLYGIEKAPFPLIISTRYADDEVLVYDDLLQVTPCHLNAIPANLYCPDWRYLLLNPKEGLKLVDKLFETAWTCIKTQFLSDSVWKKKILRDSDFLTDDDLKQYLVAGFNYPPSQFQLHLQVSLPPFRPFSWYATQYPPSPSTRRFCPITYIRKILLISGDDAYPVCETTSIYDIYDYFKHKGVDYDIEKELYTNHESMSHLRLVNWKIEDFEGVVLNGNRFYAFENFTQSRNMVEQPDEVNTDVKNVEQNNSKCDVEDKKMVYLVDNMDIVKLIREDTITIQNYGRPYVNGVPCGGYYRFPKQQPLEHFPKQSKF